MSVMFAFKYSAGAAARSMPTYDDGSTPTLVTEKPSVMQATAIQTGNTGANGSGVTEECVHALACSQPEAVAFAQNTRDEVRVQGDGTISGALAAQPGMKQTTYVVALQSDGSTSINSHGNGYQEDVSGTLATGNDQTIFGGGYVVRRLTPVECERLQGFPDGWTDLTGCDADAVAEKVAASLLYDERKSAALLRKVRKWSQECPDGPRYKACGNSMAVPVMRWIGSRIQMVDEMEVRE